MSEWTRDPAALPGLVAQGDPASVLEAFKLASTMSLAAVRERLDDDFLDGNAEAATRFFSYWLPRLPAYERMAAVSWVAGQYVLSMVHLDHAYGVGARFELEALAEVTRETAASLEAFRAFTDGPDAEVAEVVADRLDRLAATVRAAHDEIAAEVAALPQRPEGSSGGRRPRRPSAGVQRGRAGADNA